MVGRHGRGHPGGPGDVGSGGDDVEAVGLAGQMHGLVALDRHDDVLRPAILWNDQRTEAECDLIRETIGRDRLIAVTGNDALTGFTAPKLLWVRRNEPDVWSAIAHILLPKDFVRLRLTGDHAVDRADGAGTLLFDLAARDWSDEVVEALGIDRSWLPTDLRGTRDHRRDLTGGCGRDRAAGGHTGRRGRRRSSGGRGGCGCRRARRRVALARHLGGGVRDDRRTADRPGGPAARVLPCRSRPMARDGRDAVGRRQPPLVPRRARSRCRVRRAGRRGSGGAAGQRRAAVPAVPVRRTDAVSGPARPRRVRRAAGEPRPLTPDPFGPGGRGVRAEGFARADACGRRDGIG